MLQQYCISGALALRCQGLLTSRVVLGGSLPCTHCYLETMWYQGSNCWHIQVYKLDSCTMSLAPWSLCLYLDSAWITLGTLYLGITPDSVTGARIEPTFAVSLWLFILWKFVYFAHFCCCDHRGRCTPGCGTWGVSDVPDSGLHTWKFRHGFCLFLSFSCCACQVSQSPAVVHPGLLFCCGTSVPW